jgi:hypothetical protein
MVKKTEVEQFASSSGLPSPFEALCAPNNMPPPAERPAGAVRASIS